ncbi:hypothetical protein FOZ63_011174 [Perkinsus olseni]|uniref:GTP-binding protein 10 n=1 Tax=Perkinsus olseni TaxID=32597 RepID=A0A7J6QHV1_PEROL|nr:hypothetical protein FOZ63_011174 [Perkinsus olseni]
MMNLFTTWLMVIQLLAVATGQLSGRFRYDAGDYSLVLDVDKDGDVRLTVDVPRRRFRSRSFPLSGGTRSVAQVDGFFSIFNYTVDASPSAIAANWYRPIRRRVRNTNIEQGDLTNLGFTDLGTIYARYQGQEIVFEWETAPLSPGLFSFRDSAGDQVEVDYRVSSDDLVDVRVGCRGLDGVRATFKLVGITSPRNIYFLFPHEGSSYPTFLNQVIDLCGEVRGFFDSINFADQNRLYAPFSLDGRLSSQLPLDRV